MKIYALNRKQDIDPKLLREWNIGGRPVYTVDNVEYMPPRNLGSDRIYSIPIQSIEEGWKKDKEYYFGQGEEDVIGRRERFREWRKNKIPIETPEIYVDQQGVVYFTNGRHRFAELRDEGRLSIAVAVAEGSDKAALDRMGATPL